MDATSAADTADTVLVSGFVPFHHQQVAEF
jgi:hypothetical protein